MKAKSIKGNSPEEISARLKDSISEGFKPTLAIVFISEEKNLEAICNLLDLEGISIFGASSGGEFIDGEIEDMSVVILLLEIDPSYFKIEFIETGTSTTRDIARHVGESGLKYFKKPAFIVAHGGISTNGEMIVSGIQDAVGENVTIFGGLASGYYDKGTTKTFVFVNGRLSYNGLVAIIFDQDKVNINGLAIGGWQPVGMTRTITKSEGNVVYTIDNEPAMDLVMRYFGASKENLVESDDLIMNISRSFQMQLQRENSYSVMRTPMYANKQDRSIVYAGSVPQGSKVKFSLMPGFEVIDHVVDEFFDLKKEEPEADAMIMFSCKGRQLALGPYISEEINRVKNVWGAPMAGFFCYGEIGKVSHGRHEFHNMTCSLVLLKEKNK